MLFHVKGEAVWADYLKTPCSSWFSEKMTEVSYYKKEEKEIISVVIPSKDNPEILKTCLLSLAKGEFPGERLEIVVVDNGSNAENRAAVEGLQKQLAEMSVKMQYVYEPMEFNFSAMCNRGAELSNGEYVLFLNDDMEMCQDGWLYSQCSGNGCPLALTATDLMGISLCKFLIKPTFFQKQLHSLICFSAIHPHITQAFSNPVS